MSLANTLAKIYVRYVFRDAGEFNALKTQREFNVPDPPRAIAKRCETIKTDACRSFWIDRQNAKNGVLVYLHGGAFYFGPVKEHWEYLARIAKRSGKAAVMVDYGIAPQVKFPVALNEIVTLVTELDLGENWYFLGDSSGSAMAVSAFFKLRELGRRGPKKMILMSPWIDVTLKNPAIDLNKHEDVMMTVERLSSAAEAYAAGCDLTDPLISPIFGDVAGLPPLLIQMGTADLLLWDCRKFFQKCLDAGVSVTYEEYPNAFHDFMMLAPLPESRRAIKSQAAFLLSESTATAGVSD